MGGWKVTDMRIPAVIAAAAMLLAACGSRDDRSAAMTGNEAEAPLASNGAFPAAPAKAGRESSAARWALQSGDEGVALALPTESGGVAIRLVCPSGLGRLLVNVPAFGPVASEERLSLGSGGEVVALVAEARGDRRRGGVSATGAVPGNLAALIGGPLSASYGAQSSGPHPAPPQALSRAFVAACREPAAANRPTAPIAASSGSPCLAQDGERLRVGPLLAVGTEPFWGARIEGRCVTYSHPDDQEGTRLWTRFTPGPGGGTWSGALGGRRFKLRTRPQPGCSDGMSDRRYPLAVDVEVGGERHSGCAAPL